jgi:hypothetical protein
MDSLIFFNYIIYYIYYVNLTLNKNKMRLKDMKIKSIFILAILLFAFALSGCATYSTPAYSGGFISVSTPNFAFSFGEGVNAYYAPMFQTYIYGYNGYYYRWLNGGWVYASIYSGPWYSVPPTVVLPGPLVYGPPPPIIAYRPYFIWWRLHAAPWYRVYHPGWWVRHQAFIRHYSLWRSHVGRFYANHPFYAGKMRRIFNLKHKEKTFRQRHPAERGHPGNFKRFNRNHGR